MPKRACVMEGRASGVAVGVGSAHEWVGREGSTLEWRATLDTHTEQQVG